MARSSKIFFAVFFSLIAISVAFTFEQMYIAKNYIQFSSYDDVPSQSQMWRDVYESILGIL